MTIDRIECPKCKKSYKDFRHHLTKVHSFNDCADMAAEYIWLYQDLSR